MKTQLSFQQVALSTQTPMQTLSDTQIGQVAGGGISCPELLTTPTLPTTDQIASPEL